MSPRPGSPRPEGEAALEVRRRTLFWPLWMASILLPLLAYGIGAWDAWRSVKEEARARVARSVDMLHEHALRAFETQEALLEAADAMMLGYDWATVGRSAEMHLFLTRLAGRAPFLGSLGLVDPAGRMVMASSVPQVPLTPIDQNDRDYVLAHRQGHGGTFVGAMVVTRPTGTRMFALSRAHKGVGGVPDGGVVTAAFAAEAFARFYASIAESPGDVISLVRLDGAVLARHPLPPQPIQLDPNSAALRAVADAKAGPRVLEGGSPIDGRTRLNGVRQVRGYPVAVVYGLGPGPLREAWLRHVRSLGLVCATAAALLLALTAHAARSTRREARALAAAAAEAEHARAEAVRRAEAEDRLRRSERSAALGQIAAGVAHDMNNLVQSVVAAARLLDRRAENPSEVRRLSGLVRDAAARGARLARRMLEFGRAAPDGAERFDIAATLNGLEALLGGLLGSGLRLRCTAPADLPEVEADRRELETVLVNLVVNARDAMPDGGEVAVTAALDPSAGAALPGLRMRPGPMVRLSVADTGTGMPPEVLARAEEPFFSTKPTGKGTGLGLTMARQFAERAGGAMRIESAPGRGTTIILWLPAAGVAPAPLAGMPAEADQA